MSKKVIIVIGVAAVLILAVAMGVFMFRKTDWYMFSDESGELNIMKLDDSIDSNTQKINFVDADKKGYEYYAFGTVTVSEGNAMVVFSQNGKDIKEIELEKGEHQLEKFSWRGEQGPVSVTIKATYTANGTYTINAYRRTSNIRSFINEKILKR
ncbi:MAG: hypothetical protein NC393_12610 [Clostridium sp.]|nr:hypothetical protein [Clostridium sp.]MCM1208861.1 hypothetical protein [Ruminococcus sp.]